MISPDTPPTGAPVPLPAIDSASSRLFRLLLLIGGLLVAWLAAQVPMQLDVALDPVRDNRIDRYK